MTSEAKSIGILVVYCIYIYVHIYVYNVHIYVYIYIYVHVCMYVCVHMYVYMYLYIYTCIHIFTGDREREIERGSCRICIINSIIRNLDGRHPHKGPRIYGNSRT